MGCNRIFGYLTLWIQVLSEVGIDLGGEVGVFRTQVAFGSIGVYIYNIIYIYLYYIYIYIFTIYIYISLLMGHFGMIP